MSAEGKSLARYLGVIVLGLVIVQAAIAGKVDAVSVVPLTQLTPGSVLVVTSAGDDTFDKQPANNEVTFILGNKQSKAEKAIFSDGRTLAVKVPDQAGSGIITIQKNGTPVSTLNMSASGATPDYFLITAFPIAFFLLFLIWLGISLKKDPNWHLGEALSEHFVEKVAVLDEQGKPLLKDGKDPIYYERGKYLNSSSRLIAFIGLFVMATAILATLVPAVYRFALTGEVPDMGNFSTYLLAQTGIFAPYVANKIVEGVKAPGVNQGNQDKKP